MSKELSNPAKISILYAFFNICLGNITEKSILELCQNPRMKELLTCGREEVSQYCKACPFFKMCRSGCKQMKHSMYLNQEETYCGYQDFLKTHYSSLQQIANLSL